jgi:hypothetical protein
MRQVREVLRLTTAGVGLNEIARRAGVAPSTVRLTLRRLASAGLSWPLPAEMPTARWRQRCSPPPAPSKAIGVISSLIGLRSTASSSASTSP